MTKTYRVVVTREGESWLADVLDVAGTHTWAKNLPSLDRSVREAIALAEDLPDGAEGGLALDYGYSTGHADWDAQAAELRAERERVSRAERELAERTAELAGRLVRGGLSVRDVAVLLRVSPQRISQVAPRKSRSHSSAA